MLHDILAFDEKQKQMAGKERSEILGKDPILYLSIRSLVC